MKKPGAVTRPGAFIEVAGRIVVYCTVATI
jgi:hypothetical protein